MISAKKSDGIRKKGDAPPAHRLHAAQDESPTISLAPRERADDKYAAAPKAPPRKEAPDFLTHWKNDQELSDQRMSEEYADDNAQIIEDETPVPARAPVSWSEVDEAPLAPIPQGRWRWTTPANTGTRMARWGMAAGGIALAALLVFVSFWGASLTIAFTPHVYDINLQDISVAFDTSVAKTLLSQKVIPAEELSFPKKSEESFAATGKQQIADRARGKAVIVNSFSSSPQILIAGTRFLTDAGILFRLQKPVTVPGAKIEEGKIIPQSVAVDLTADAIGEGSNISGKVILKIPGFKGTPRYDGFVATAAEGFAGGFKGEATVVSADDLKNAQELVTKALFDDLRAEMGRKIPSGFTVLPELQSVEITKVAAPAAGTHTERFSVSADAVGKAMVFRQDDATTLIKAFALADSPDQELVDGSSALRYHARSIDFDKGRADMTIEGSIRTKAIVNQAELAALVAGKKSGSIADTLRARPEIARFTLSLFPPWRSSAPSDPAKIHFRSE